MTIRWKIAQRCELWWWGRYLSRHDPSSYLKWKRQYWREFLTAHDIDVQSQEMVLDAGCGPAGIFTVLPQANVFAVDPLLDQYEKKFTHFNKQDYPGVHFINEQLENLPAGHLFDKVFCLNAINHVADLKTCLKKISMCLKKGGELYLSVDVHNFYLFKKIFQWLPGDILHPHQLSLKEYCSFLLNNGVKIQSTDLIKKEFIFDYYLIKGIKK